MTDSSISLESLGQCKRTRLERLIKLYNKKGISYNIKELSNLSRKDIQRMQYEVTGKKWVRVN